MSRPRPAPRSPPGKRLAAAAGRARAPEEPPTATGPSEPPPRDPAARGRLCPPKPSPGGLRDIRSGPVSGGGGLTRRGRLGARRASAGTGPPSEGTAGLGRNRGSLARARCGGCGGFGGERRVAGENRPGPGGGSGGWGDRGSRTQRAWCCLPASRGWENSVCATCLCREPGQHPRLQQVSNLRPAGSTAGEGVPEQMGEPLTIPDAKRTEGHPGSATLSLFRTEASLKIPNNTSLIWRTY